GLSAAFLVVLARRNRDLTEQTRIAREEAGRANAARDELEATLAESLLRPLGLEDGPLTPVEMETLWKLAELPNDGVRLRLLKLALARPETAERLGRRADVVVRSAVGLDPEKRGEASRLLRAALAGGSADPRVRRACVEIGLSLGETDPAFVRELL